MSKIFIIPLFEDEIKISIYQIILRQRLQDGSMKLEAEVRGLLFVSFLFLVLVLFVLVWFNMSKSNTE